MIDTVLQVILVVLVWWAFGLMIWDRLGKPKFWRWLWQPESADVQTDSQTDSQTPQHESLDDVMAKHRAPQVDRTLPGLVAHLVELGWTVSEVRERLKGDNGEIGRLYKAANDRQLAAASGAPEVWSADGQRQPMTYPVTNRK